MQNTNKLSVLASIGLAAIAVPAFGAEPPGTPGEIAIPPDWSQEGSVPNSDQHRIVAKVLRIDRQLGLVTIAAEDGVLVVELHTLPAINVGDTVSVPRPEVEAPSALPRE